MTGRDEDYGRKHGLMRVPRSRGALSGLLLIALGAWGAVIPFVGPYFHYSYTPDSALTWTAGRFWLEVLPGIAAIIGGFLILTTANRAVAVFAGYLASAAGAWFVVGPVLGQLWKGSSGMPGMPVGGTVSRTVETIGFFAGLGAVILFIAAQALGRFTVRSVRDVKAVERHHDDKTQGNERAVVTSAPATYPEETRTAGEVRSDVPVGEMPGAQRG